MCSNRYMEIYDKSTVNFFVLCLKCIHNRKNALSVICSCEKFHSAPFSQNIASPGHDSLPLPNNLAHWMVLHNVKVAERKA